MIIDLKLPQWATLLACPFCGGPAELDGDGEGVYARCATGACVIKPITLTYPTKRDAIRAWNRRPA